MPHLPVARRHSPSRYPSMSLFVLTVIWKTLQQGFRDIRVLGKRLVWSQLVCCCSPTKKYNYNYSKLISQFLDLVFSNKYSI